MCLLAESLDADELERYHWWINSQLDVTKWEWSSPDKAGTEPLKPLREAIRELEPYLPSAGDWDNKYAKARMVADALGRPIVFMDQNRNYFDEQGQPVELFQPDGRPTLLGTKAIVMPPKPIEA